MAMFLDRGQNEFNLHVCLFCAFAQLQESGPFQGAKFHKKLKQDTIAAQVKLILPTNNELKDLLATGLDLTVCAEFAELKKHLLAAVDAVYLKFEGPMSSTVLDRVMAKLRTALGKPDGVETVISQLQPSHSWLHDSLPLKTWMRTGLQQGIDFTVLHRALKTHRDLTVIPTLLRMMTNLICQ